MGLIFLTFCSHVGRINADLSEYGWENWHDITIEGNIHATIKFDFLEANKIEFPLGLKLSRNKKLDASNKASNNSLFVTNPTSKPLNVTFILKRMLNKLSALNGSVVSFWGMPLLRVSDHNFHLASKSSI